MKYALIEVTRAIRTMNNPLFEYAVSNGYVPIPIYCVDEDYYTGKDAITGIPHVMGMRYNWLVECLLDFQSTLITKGLDLCVLVGNPQVRIKELVGLLTQESGNTITICSLSFPDAYELSLSKKLEGVCKELGLEFKRISGYSSYVNVPKMFPTKSRVPKFYNHFLKCCYGYILRGEGIIKSCEYTLSPWSLDLYRLLEDFIKGGVEELTNLCIPYKSCISIKEEVLGFSKEDRLEEKGRQCVNSFINEGGAFSYNPKKLQSTSKLSPLINHGVIPPYVLFNECLSAYRELLVCKRFPALEENYFLLIKRMLLGAYGVCLSNVEGVSNTYNISSSTFNRTLDLSKYKGVEESKDLINTMSFEYEGGDDRSINTISTLIRLLMNRGYVSHRVRIAIALCLKECGIHPFVIRDLFQAFLIDYIGYNTYAGLAWCLNISSFRNEHINPVSITKQLTQIEYDLCTENDHELSGGWNNGDINALSVPYILEGSRLPVRRL